MNEPIEDGRVGLSSCQLRNHNDGLMVAADRRQRLWMYPSIHQVPSPRRQARCSGRIHQVRGRGLVPSEEMWQLVNICHTQLVSATSS